MASVKKQYRLVRGKHSRVENGVRKTYSAGDKINLTDDEAKLFTAGRLDPEYSHSHGGVNVNVPGQYETEPSDRDLEGESDSEELESETDWSFIADENLSTVKDIIDRTKSVSDLQALADSERSGNNRKGVLDAVNARIKQLNG